MTHSQSPTDQSTNTNRSSGSSDNSFGVLGLLAKLGAKLAKPVFTLLKSGKILKILLAGGSFAVYSVLLSWQFAVLLMVGIGIHEMGHLAAMRYKNMGTKGMYYIPMLGAAAVPEEDFPSYWDESFIAAAGPVAGLLVGVGTLTWYTITGLPFAAAATAWIGVVHIFNLLPVKPLDGGRMWSAIAFSFGRPYSIVALSAFAIIAAGVGVMYGLGIILFIVPLGLLEIVSDYVSNRRTIRPNTSITDHDIVGYSYTINVTPNLILDDDTEDGIPLLDDTSQQWIVTSVDDAHVTLIPRTTVPLSRRLLPTRTQYDAYIDSSTPVTTISHDTFRRIIDSKHTGQPKPRMDRHGLVNTLAMYGVLLVASVGLMIVTNHVAGADAALSALK